MTEAKIDPRLREEMERAEAAGDAARPISVVIAHAGTTSGAQEVSGLDYAALERRVQAAHRGLRARLAELGAAAEVRQITLANALEARLTPAQIRAIADHPDVGTIVLNREERVTT